MKLLQSHVVATAVALVVAVFSCAIATTRIMQAYAQEPAAPSIEFDPNGMVGHGDLVNQLLKLLQEVDGEAGSPQRLASARRVETAILAVEAKIDRTWTEQGKKQLALIKYVRSALKEELNDPIASSNNHSDMAALSILFACGAFGWAITKWVNQRYASFEQSRFHLKMKANTLTDLDELDEGPAYRKGGVTPKNQRKGSASPTTPKSKAKNARRQRTPTSLQKEVVAEEPLPIIVSSSPEMSRVSVTHLDRRSQEPTALTKQVLEMEETERLPTPDGECPQLPIMSRVAEGQNAGAECDVVALSEGPVTCCSSAAVDWAEQEETSIHFENGPEIEGKQTDAAWPAKGFTEELESELCSIHESKDQQGDAKNGVAFDDMRKELQTDGDGCVYAPLTPGGSMRKFWPVLINEEQFYTDGTQFFQMARLPVYAAPEPCKVDSDDSVASAADDGVSTADSDAFCMGLTMTRSQSEPSFPVQWME